jgi:hypothetical protein
VTPTRVPQIFPGWTLLDQIAHHRRGAQSNNHRE